MEFERNKEIGSMLGHWKGGMLINDDQGRVKKLLQTHPYPESTGKKLPQRPSGPTEVRNFSAIILHCTDSFNDKFIIGR
mgnify:CR=1 FL=1